jgi:hypothetical protein
MRLILPVVLLLVFAIKSASQEEPVEYPPSQEKDSIQEVVKICVFAMEPVETKHWRAYLQDSLELDSAFTSKIPPGRYRTIIEFEANKDGYILNAKIILDPGYGLGEKALQEIKKYKSRVLSPNASGSFRRQPITFVIEEEDEEEENECLLNNI